jgi:hypothetical protein
MNDGDQISSGDEFILAAGGVNPVRNVSGIGVVGTSLYFAGQFQSSSSSRGLYLLTAPGGTPQLVQNLTAGTKAIQVVGSFNGKFIYVYNGKLWSATGTTETQISSATFGTPSDFQIAGTERAYFVNGADGTLWTTDGTSAGTKLLGTVSPFAPTLVASADGDAYFNAVDGSLIFTDGTVAGTVLETPLTQRPGTIAGTVFDDRNGNGTRQYSKENGLRGYRVIMDLNGDGVWQSDTEPSTTCSKTGRFTFPNVAAGRYWIQVMDYSLAGRRATTVDRYRVRVSNNATVTRYFALTKRALISGQVYVDKNANGTKDGSDAGTSGFAVYVDLNGDNFPGFDDPHVLTDGAGRYSFALPAGTYILRVYPRSGYISKTPGAGYRRITVGSGEVVINQNFGQTIDPFGGGIIFGGSTGSGVIF